MFWITKNSASLSVVFATLVATPLFAQSQGGAAAVPGPYQTGPDSAPSQTAAPSSLYNQRLPYWMQAPARINPFGQAPAVRTTPPAAAQNYIPGWVWSPFSPNAQGANSGGVQPNAGLQGSAGFGGNNRFMGNAPGRPQGYYGAPQQPGYPSQFNFANPWGSQGFAPFQAPWAGNGFNNAYGYQPAYGAQPQR